MDTWHSDHHLAAVAIFVIYLSERITVFETLLGINPKLTGEKLAEHVNLVQIRLRAFWERSLASNVWKRARESRYHC